jgi:hypothetical protein
MISILGLILPRGGVLQGERGREKSDLAVALQNKTAPKPRSFIPGSKSAVLMEKFFLTKNFHGYNRLKPYSNP